MVPVRTLQAMDDKATIRRRMRMVRDMVDDRLMRSVELWGKVAALAEYQAASTVMAFNGFTSEPDTDPLFARLAAEGKRLLLPRIQDGNIVVCAAEGQHSRSNSSSSSSCPASPSLPTVRGSGMAAASTTGSFLRSRSRTRVCASPSRWWTPCPSKHTTSVFSEWSVPDQLSS
jgi:hypothetical protein